MGFSNVIILRSEDDVRRLSAIVNANWRFLAEHGTPLSAHLAEYRGTRSLEQQSLMWIRLQEIAEQAWINGRQYSADVWHIHCKRDFLPDEDGPSKRCRAGYRKWVILPSGDRDLVGTTTLLTVYGMSEYLDKLMAWGSTELGVRFSATQHELLMSR